MLSCGCGRADVEEGMGHYDGCHLRGAKFTLNGEEVFFEDFIRDNREGLDPEEIDAIRLMRPNAEMRFGGGAAPIFVLRRVA